MRNAREEGQVILIEANWVGVELSALHHILHWRHSSALSEAYLKTSREFGISSTSQGFNPYENPDFNS